LNELQIVSTPTPEPPATPIPPTPTPQPTETPLPPIAATPTPFVSPTPVVSAVEQLLKKGGTCFKDQQYTTPANDNAFDYYKEVLEKEAANPHAKGKIYDIVNVYKNWGDSAYAQKNCNKAQTVQ